MKPDSGVSPGLCASCARSEIIRSSRGSTFYRCRLSDTDSRFPKYPRLPVMDCPGWDETTNNGNDDVRKTDENL